MAADAATCSPARSDNRAVDHDLTGVDHGLGVATRPGQPAPDQLAIQALSHGSARLSIVTLVVWSVQCLMQRLVGFREPIVMIGKRSRTRSASSRSASSIAACPVGGGLVQGPVPDLDLPWSGSVTSSGSEALSALAAGGGL